jgi:indole-3-glycerol phosphate synthase/phosphoribosylanthranilate isomerase
MADPAGILGEIATSKREELKARFHGVSIDALRAQALPTRRSLADTIAGPGARFILEIKKASPSVGPIRVDADAGALARSYAGVSDALSVLTDARYFGGSLEDVAAARTEFQGPILAKDFFLDPRQIAEARIAGADAMLIMLSLLDDGEARALIGEARRFGMDALVEVHDEVEMRRALGLGAPLIGINNRDLRDLSIDLATTERLAGMARDRLLVGESGISDRADVERLSPHADGFLVGSAVMRAEHPAEAAREMIFGRVKLCGLNRADDVDAARAASFAGFVLIPDTPRHVAAAAAIPLAQLAKSRGLRPLGVFRDQPAERVAEIARAAGLHAVQLHGREDADYVSDLRPQLPPDCEIWTAASVGRDRLSARGGDRIVFDNASGGTGRTFDWRLVEDDPHLPRAILAGGIGPANARAAQRLGAYAIDVGSAVDAAPGVKSAEKIHALFEALRPASRERLSACA